ncbi:hypothetical protein [Rummeliibacillus suwonensis]|nr:hypothetical protein [Rummeliibacillus suwonensis]MBO2535693.1 hypothetical protein [Rummeliibacillus suwonensis]
MELTNANDHGSLEIFIGNKVQVTGTHTITPHNGGRTKGMWVDAPR